MKFSVRNGILQILGAVVLSACNIPTVGLVPTDTPTPAPPPVNPTVTASHTPSLTTSPTLQNSPSLTPTLTTSPPLQNFPPHTPTFTIEPPIIPPEPTDAPPDTTPPTISDVNIDPTTIQKMGCGTPDTFTISAIVSDASEIGNVTYVIDGPGPMDGGEGYLLPAGGDLYQAIIGPIAGSAGTWSLTLRALDMAFNAAEAGPWTINIVCIG